MGLGVIFISFLGGFCTYIQDVNPVKEVWWILPDEGFQLFKEEKGWGVSVIGDGSRSEGRHLCDEGAMVAEGVARACYYL